MCRTVVLIALLMTAFGGAHADSPPPVDRADPSNLEEVVVSAGRLAVPSQLEMADVYRARDLGMKHFRRRDYAKAYPHLLTAAKRGFKTAQARLAYIYLRGLGGIPYDPVRGVGWLSVAATPDTLPWIRRYASSIWDLVPERHLADLEVVADRYRAKYGTQATGVSCNRNRRAGTHRVSLMCLFDEESMHENSVDREALRELWFDPENCPTGHGCVQGLQ